MGSVASELKLEREKRKISLAQIAADTRISLRYLESLEEGRYQDLPGGMYNRAFLRAYCESLNLNQQEIIRRYEAEISPPLDRPLKSKAHIAQKNASLRPSPVVVWSMMLLISAAGIFFSRKWIATVFSPYFSHRPAASVAQELSRHPAPATEQPLATAAPDATPPTPAQNTTAEPPAVAAPVASASVSPVDQVVATTDSKELGSQASQSHPSLRLEIEATADCWISVDRDGNPAVRKLLKPGEAQAVSASEQLLMILGNAGGVRVRINGKPAKSMGKSGEVVKTLINEKNLQDLLDHTSG
jgi:cytoskeleton protein RodZ